MLWICLRFLRIRIQPKSEYESGPSLKCLIFHFYLHTTSETLKKIYTKRRQLKCIGTYIFKLTYALLYLEEILFGPIQFLKVKKKIRIQIRNPYTDSDPDGYRILNQFESGS